MGRKQTKVETLHDHTVESLIELEQGHTNKHSRRALRAIIMSYQNIHLNDIQKILGVSRATLLSYIHRWNLEGLSSIEDGRGGSESSFTDEMLSEISTILISKDPREFGYISSVWSINRVRDYVAKKFGRQYSYERIRQIILSLGFSFKRGEYHPTFSNPQKQNDFKKNAKNTRYCRRFF